MASHSSRELSVNPAAMLRDLEAGAHVALAARLPQSGAISMGTAARIAGRSIEEMIELLDSLRSGPWECSWRRDDGTSYPIWRENSTR